MKFQYTLGLAAAVLCLTGHAQVKVSEEQYRVAAPTNSRGPLAAVAAPAVALSLPIDEAPGADGQARPFVLRRGEPIHTQLQAWARAAGWELLWQPTVSWKTVSNADFNKFKEVSEAIEAVINVLREEGKPVRLLVAEGNHVMEVVSNEVLSEVK